MAILIKPIISEKSMSGIPVHKYVFAVEMGANKPEIAKAIFTLYKVKPIKINIVAVKGEKKLVRGRYLAKIKPWKKAIITLKKTDKIPGFEEK